MERLAKIFQTLIQIDSPTGYEGNLADFLVGYFYQKNLLVEKDHAGNVFLKIEGVGEPLFLAAHMDTVEPGRNIVSELKDEEFFSNGKTILGADNKSMIAVLIEMTERLQEKNIKHKPLEILFTTSEESTNSGAKEFNFTKLTAKKGIISDVSAAVGSIVLASPAYLRIDIQLTGKASHAARPEKANSVLPVISEFLSSPFIGKIDTHTIFNIGLIHAGSARNTIPGSAFLQGELRSFDEGHLRKYVLDITENFQKIAQKRNITIDILHEIDNHAYVFQETDSFVQEISTHFNSQKIIPTYIKRWSCSDANIFNKKGIQVINIGDGTRNTHTIEESIKISEMEKLVNFFYSVAKYE